MTSRKQQAQTGFPYFSRRKVLLLASAGAIWLSQSGFGLADDPFSIRKGRRRITPLCQLPPNDYRHGSRSPSVVIRSLPAINQLSKDSIDQIVKTIRASQKQLDALKDLGLEADLVAKLRQARAQEAQLAVQLAAKPKGKLLQLATKELTIAHCKVSDIALLIEPTGFWHLSLRGDQNFQRPDEEKARNTQLQMKRNAFNIEVRLLTANRGKARENLLNTPSAEPNFEHTSSLALVELKIPEFWVQREAPQFITQTGYHPSLQTHFDKIDRAEFEFFVRLDPLTGSGKGVVQIGEGSP
ncbi:MAG: hypothetical protein AAF483_07985 [Planctomycetota bacterium]